MKKLVSLVTILCMALSLFAIPAVAAEPTISVGTIAEGEVYTEGANIVLTADTSGMAEETIVNVDFYANGDKLPGTLAGGTGSLIWYAPAAGSYAVTAKATTSGSATVESTAVNIEVKKENIVNVLKMNSADDVKNFYVGLWESTATKATDAYVSQDYTAYSPYSLYIEGFSHKSNQFISIEGLSGNVTADAANLYIPIYNAGEAVEYHIIVLNSGTTVKRLNAITLNPGWNIGTVPLTAGNAFDEIQFGCYGYGITTSNDEAHYNAKIYINGAFLAASAPVAPTVTATSIPDGQTKVCNNLSKYRITFSDAVASTANAITVVKNSDSTEVTEGVTVNADANYIDVLFAEGTLTYNETYTVSVANSVASILGAGFAGAEYTFSTAADQCTEAQPIPSVVYPKAGADVATNTKLAAKVIFNSNVSKVEFYNGTNLIGEATNYTGNEYQLDNATLTEGENTIKAVVTLNDDTTYESATITVNAAPATEYAVYGIENNERVLINDRDYKTIAVINKADVSTSKTGTSLTIPDADNVSKVNFILNGVLAETDADAPYTWNMPFEKLGDNTLEIEVLDQFGTLTSYGYSYKTVYGKELNRQATDFTAEDYEVFSTSGLTTNSSGTVVGGASVAEHSDGNIQGNALAATHGTNAVGYVQPLNYVTVPLTTKNESSARMLRVEFDFKQTERYSKLVFRLYQSIIGSNVYGNILEVASDSKVLKYNNTYHVTVDADFASGLMITYVDGVEMVRQTMSNNPSAQESVSFIFYMQNWGSSTPTCYLDNISLTSYSYADEALVEKEGSTVKVINPTADDYDLKAITATYNGNQLADVVIDDVTVPTNGIVNKEYTVGANDKLFVWKDFVTLKPLVPTE